MFPPRAVDVTARWLTRSARQCTATGTGHAAPEAETSCCRAQMADFMRSVEGDVRAAEEVEQAEAERFAAERGDREAFEQRSGRLSSSVTMQSSGHAHTLRHGPAVAWVLSGGGCQKH